MRRVRSADPESAELADVALAALGILEFIWREVPGHSPPLVPDQAGDRGRSGSA